MVPLRRADSVGDPHRNGTAACARRTNSGAVSGCARGAPGANRLSASPQRGRNLRCSITPKRRRSPLRGPARERPGRRDAHPLHRPVSDFSNSRPADAHLGLAAEPGGGIEHLRHRRTIMGSAPSFERDRLSARGRLPVRKAVIGSRARDAVPPAAFNARARWGGVRSLRERLWRGQRRCDGVLPVVRGRARREPA